MSERINGMRQVLHVLRAYEARNIDWSELSPKHAAEAMQAMLIGILSAYVDAAEQTAIDREIANDHPHR